MDIKIEFSIEPNYTKAGCRSVEQIFSAIVSAIPFVSIAEKAKWVESMLNYRFDLRPMETNCWYYEVSSFIVVLGMKDKLLVRFSDSFEDIERFVKSNIGCRSLSVFITHPTQGFKELYIRTGVIEKPWVIHKPIIALKQEDKIFVELVDCYKLEGFDTVSSYLIEPDLDSFKRFDTISDVGYVENRWNRWEYKKQSKNKRKGLFRYEIKQSNRRNGAESSSHID